MAKMRWQKFKYIEIKPKNILIIKKRFTKNKVIKKEKAIYEILNPFKNISFESTAEMILSVLDTNLTPTEIQFIKEIETNINKLLKSGVLDFEDNKEKAKDES